MTVLIFAFGAEIYYRYLNPEILGNTGSLSYKKWSKDHVKLNSWGFRDVERSARRLAGVDHRILMFGPSNVYGQGVTDLEQRITERLEKKLNENGSTAYEVINCGLMTLDTLGTAMSLTRQYYSRGMDFDSVVVYLPWNSIKFLEDILNEYKERKNAHYEVKKENKIENFFKKNSYAYNWLSNVSKDKSYTPDEKSYVQWHLDHYKDKTKFYKYLSAIKGYNDALAKVGKKLFLLVVPISYNEEEREEYAEVEKIFFNSLSRMGIAYADVTDIFDGIPEAEIPVSKYDGHNKPKYYKNMVEILAPVIKENTKRE